MISPSKCHYCGAELERLSLGGRTFHISKPCDCVGAKNAEAEAIRAEQAERDKNAREAQIRRISALFKESGIGGRFVERTFDTFKADTQGRIAMFSRACKFCEEFIENQKTPGLFFTGTPGTGKTHLAAAISNKLIKEHAIPVLFTTAASMFARLRQTYDAGSKETETAIMSALCNVPLLILDDIDKFAAKSGDSWAHDRLYTVINTRYENYRPVIITTNASPDELEAKLTQPIMSRITEMCRGVVCTGPDYRRE